MEEEEWQTILRVPRLSMSRSWVKQRGRESIKSNSNPFCPTSTNRLFFHLAIRHKDQLPDDLAPMLNGYRLSRLALLPKLDRQSWNVLKITAITRNQRG